METEFIPIDYSYFDFQGKNYIKIIGRNKENKRIVLIDSCPIYLWAILKQKTSNKKINSLKKEIEKIQIENKERTTKIEKIELKEKNFLNKKVKSLKIFATNYKDLKHIADRLDFEEIEKRRGYDLGFITHYIIEKQIKPLRWYQIKGELLHNSKEFGGIDLSYDVDFCIKLKSSKETKEKKFLPTVVAYDIECDDLKVGEGEILMVSLKSNKNNFKKVVTWKKTKNMPSYVEKVKDEEELIERFVEQIKELSPDFLVGYASDNFDLPYLKERAKKHKTELALGLNNKQPRFSRGNSGETTGKIEGIVHIDLIKFIRTIYSQYMKSETLTLNEVAKEFLKDSKKDFEIKHSSKLNTKELKKYYEYNLHDSTLALNLFKKFWPDMLEFSKITQEPLFNVSRSGLSKIVDSYLLHNLEKFNEIPEKKPTYKEISERKKYGNIKGAFVYEPTPGLYENIAMFDFTSMHTSIIISHNISKGTLLEKKKKDSYPSPKIEINGKTKKFYFSKKTGFFPKLLEEIFEKRKHFKSQYKKSPNAITLARSNAFKVLSASIHGYIGFFGSRYYSFEASNTILALVRKYNKGIIQKIEKKGYKVVVADTDSVGFLMGEKTEKEILELLDKLNSDLPGVMHLELEDFYKRGLWVTTRKGKIGAKKKYALIDKKGKTKIRGFETVRGDWCQLARETQDKILNLILKKGNEKTALEYAKKTIKKIKKREISRKKMIIKTNLKKPISEYKTISPHVVAAQKMKKEGLSVSQGSRIQYYISEKKSKSKLIREKVKLPEEEGKYDIEYYLNNQILPAIKSIFEVFGINVEEILAGKKQMNLGEF